jgi:hypothetical protein
MKDDSKGSTKGNGRGSSTQGQRTARVPKDDPTKTKQRERDLLRKYNLTSADYDSMFLKQKGVCAICQKPERARWRGKVIRLAVDHSHKTGRVRGLLCMMCNRKIGYFGDEIESFERILSYMKGTLYD